MLELEENTHLVQAHILQVPRRHQQVSQGRMSLRVKGATGQARPGQVCLRPQPLPQAALQLAALRLAAPDLGLSSGWEFQLPVGPAGAVGREGKFQGLTSRLPPGTVLVA